MNNENIIELLNREIENEIRNLGTFDSGSKEKSDAIDDLVQLYKLRIEENKLTIESTDKELKRLNDEAANLREDECKKKERYLRLGIAGAELIVPLIFYGIWMNKGFRFEETGSITSKTFNGLINRFRPTK